MAEKMSAETKAIIDRLKAEGDLLRNTGTNSIKSVSIKLDKFDNIFQSINTNMAETANILRMQAGIAQEQLENRRTQEQFDEIKPPVADQTDPAPGQDSSSTGATIDRIGDKIESAFSLKNIILGAAGLFVGYNILKGFIDDQTGGGFSEMEKTITGIKWSDVTTTFNNITTGLSTVDFAMIGTTMTTMSTALSNINWTNFSGAVNTVTTSISSFSAWLGETGIGSIVTAVAAGGMVSAGAKGAASGVFAALAGGGKGASMASKLRMLPNALAMVTAGLGLYYGDEISAFIKDNMGQSEEDATSIKNIMVGGVSIAAMFGLTSPVGIAVLAVTGAVTLGKLISGWVSNFKNQQTEDFNNQTDEALRRAQAERQANPGSDLTEDTTAALLAAAAEASRRAQLFISNEAVEGAKQAEAAIQAQLAQQSMGDGTSGVNSLQIDRIRSDVLAGNQGAVDELFAFAEGRERETAGGFGRWITGNDSKEEFIRNIVEGLAPQWKEGMTAEDWTAAQDEWDATSQRLLAERGYRGGTGGFKDFGPGTVSILHGKEAVVPLNSPEGRILENLFNGRSPADVVSDGSGAMGGGSIIYAPTVNAPASVNVGGDKIAAASYQDNSGGGGSRGGGTVPYGLTGAFS